MFPTFHEVLDCNIQKESRFTWPCACTEVGSLRRPLPKCHLTKAFKTSEAGPFHQLLGCLIINTKVDDHFSDKRPFNEQAPYFLRRLLGKPHKRRGFVSGTWVDVLARHPDGPAPSFQLEDRATWGLEGKLGAPHLVSSQICVCVSQPWCCGFHIKMAQTISFDPSPNRFQLECNQHFFNCQRNLKPKPHCIV